MNLRDYQMIAADLSAEQFGRGIRTQLIEMPTGTGKTVVMGEIARRRENFGRILFVVHRQEILWQAVIQFQKILDSYVGVVMANQREYAEPVICASIQTLARGNHLNEILSAGAIGTLLIDECHHYTPNSAYAELIDQISIANPEVLILGVSATPFRMDKVNITEVFRPVFRRSIHDMQSQMWLVETQWLPIYIENMHLDGIKSRIQDGERDFTVTELTDAMLPHAKKMAELAAPHINGRQTAIFAVSIPHMHALYSAFNQAGISTGIVYGDQDKDERRKVIESWKAGKIQAVVNVAVLTEGFDYPEISCLIMARPTQSPSFYTQMLGRGLRIVPGKKNCLVIDFTGNPNIGLEDIDTDAINLSDIMGITEQGKGEAREYHIKEFKRLSEIALVDIPDQDVFLISTEIGTFGIAENSRTGLWDVIQVVDENNVRILNKGIGYDQRTANFKLTTILKNVGGTRALWQTQARWRKGMPTRGQMTYLGNMSSRAYQTAHEEGWNRGQVSNALTRAKYAGAIKRWRKRQEREKL
jgi:superfamily II DNA or RNA helicase